MGIQLGSAYGKVGLDVSGLLNSIRTGKAGLKELGAAGIQVGQALKDVGRTLTLALTLPILAMGAASIKAASDFEETKNKALVVFAEMSEGVVKNSESAATALGVSKKEYLDYASSVGAALTAGGMAIEEATQLSERAVQHFADLASFHNTEIKDASVAWQSAIRGQFEPIQRYFPFITNQYLITYGTANGLIDKNTKELTANQRAIILNAIALDSNLNPALDDFAETSGGLANQQRILKAQFQDALIMLGQHLLPIALEVVQGLNKMLTAFNNMPAPVQKAILVLAGLLAVLGPIISFLGTIISFVSGLAGLSTTLAGLGISIGSIGAVASAAGASLLAFAASAGAVILPILLVVGAFALLYYAFKTNFGGIRTTAEQLWFILKTVFNEIKNSIGITIQQIIGIINYLRSGVVLLYEDGAGALHKLAVAFGIPARAAQDFLAKMYLIISTFKKLFQGDFAEVIRLLLLQFGVLSDGVNQALLSISRGARLLYEDGAGALLNLAVAFGIPARAAQDFLSRVFFIAAGFKKLFEGDMLEAVRNFAMGLLGITTPQFDAFYKRVQDVLRNVVNAFRNINWAQIGRYMLQGLASGMAGGIPLIVQAATQAARAALDAIKRTLGIKSPSAEFMKLGVFSGQGFQKGLANTMDPNTIARTMAKPVQTMTTNQNKSNTFNFPMGLTLRDVDRLMDEKINRFANGLERAMGGG